MKAFILFTLVLLQFFQASSQPKVNSVFPQAAPVGSTITIKGSGFNPSPDHNIVHMGTIRAKVLSGSTTELTVRVVAAATYSPISVTCDGLTAYSPLRFSNTFPGTPGIGPASFAPRKEYFVYRVSQNGALADLDGDGLADVVMTEYDQVSAFEAAPFIVSVLRNTSNVGNISFAEKIKYAIPGTLIYTAIGDFDGDGKPDVAALGYSGDFYVLKNSSEPGRIALETPMAFPIGKNFNSDFQVADIDGDGKPDVIGQLRSAVTNQNSVLICRNNSTGSVISFDAPKEYHGTSMSIGDMNGDGKPELAIDSIVYENRSTPGDIQFQPVFAGVTPQASNINDMDGDGKADFMTSKDGFTTVYRNNGGASLAFDAGVRLSTGVYYRTLADVNGDGKPDFINCKFDQFSNQTVTRNDSKVGIVANGPSTNINAIEFVSSLMVGDLDGDSKPDIINLAGHNLSIHRNITGEPLVAATGPQAVSGAVDTRTTIDPAAPIYNGRLYLQRHYDIEPRSNASTATATITLMFSQDDFDAYNKHPGHGMDLPSNPNEIAKKANLRIVQHHGTSQTGVPGTYSGSVVEIDPDDTKITWSELARACR